MTTERGAIPGTTERPNETLAANLKGLAGKADDLIRKVGHSVTEKLAETPSIVTKKACGAANATHAYVRGNPWKATGFAAAAGLLIGGLLLSRRRLP